VTLNPPTVLFGSIAALLGAVIVAELLPSHPGEAPPAADSRPAQPVVAARARPEVDRDDMVEVLLARPPFSPTRRPEAKPTVASDDAPHAVELPRLSGILVSGGQKLAIFQTAADDKPTVVAEGGNVSGWTVQTISEASVTVSGPPGTRTVQTAFDPNVKVAQPAMPPRGIQPAGQPSPAGLPRATQGPPVNGMRQPRQPGPGLPQIVPRIPPAPTGEKH
jgi:hypothetical protein